ncbi:RNA polymerase sigma-70 factor [Pedobacter sp. ASV12]|uniref:RNA polymerase sigma-70 factor n=1 Tax=Pedobacter sp. ASV12 TaxID=2795120 RepID=UPI0018EC10EA
MVNIITGQDLIDIIQESQVKAFTHFYTLFFQKLLLESDKYVKDVSVAEELVQDVFLKVWENPESLEDVRSVKSYLYRSVINASINYINRQKNIEQHHQKIAADYSEEYLMELDEENRLVVLLRIEIEKLPPQCKKVFKLNRFEKLKYREIADLLGISERTVENHIANALKILREALLDKKNVDKESKPFQKIITLYLY